MTAHEAIKVLAPLFKEELVVCTTGYTCRQMQAAADRPGNFYMIGSMGIAAALGLGTALARPDRPMVILDGDGSVLMGLGGLAMVGKAAPKNFFHVVLDNEMYASTGGQPTGSDAVALDELARAAGYRAVRRVEDCSGLISSWNEIRAGEGPAFLLVKCQADTEAVPPRVRLAPDALTERFMGTANEETVITA